jgi:hypothetical protein
MSGANAAFITRSVGNGPTAFETSEAVSHGTGGLSAVWLYLTRA